ncbi:hypothetical protein LF1_08060 [Rubripirellula obstinata]|uniref:Uncharacterized protein n=1 Tax=Rubripirellula obstinata TaxID=406547 RepID=A0A5B1CFF5_9BACT|nr:hypothetical protein [Rubripirellula obstinata]KAA1258290.1 hypothetical protein LF1_08060 [Rubripirellula obstinata]
MEDKNNSVNPNRLTVEQLAKLLTNSYRQQVPAEHIAADLAAGAPTNGDGTINLAHYAAWLLQEKHHGD